MTQPIAFPANTPAIGLPLLFAGQSQKEFFVNQAFSILDAVSLSAVIDSIDQPPTEAGDGDCYRVGSSAAGPWSGYADHLAVFVGGTWHFIPPAEGMLLFDRTAGQWLCFRSGWQAPGAPALAEGGSVVDIEARATLTQLLESLRIMGLIGPAPL